MRKNLITVPSCKEHNSDTSKDDEYVFAIICASWGTNKTAFRQFNSKTIKALADNPGFSNLFFNNVTPAFIKEGLTVSTTIDIDRFNNTLIKYAKAIHFYEFKEIWNEEFIVITPSIRFKDGSVHTLLKYIKPYKFGNIKHVNETIKGNVPEVFKYGFYNINNDDFYNFIIMVFYGSFEVWIIPYHVLSAMSNGKI